MPEPGGPGGPLAPPIFGRSVNPIQTEEGRLSPPITTGTPKVFSLAASLRVCTCMIFQNRQVNFIRSLSKKTLDQWVTWKSVNMAPCVNNNKDKLKSAATTQYSHWVELTFVPSSFTLSASKSQESSFETLAFMATMVMTSTVSFRRLYHFLRRHWSLATYLSTYCLISK